MHFFLNDFDKLIERLLREDEEKLESEGPGGTEDQRWDKKDTTTGFCFTFVCVWLQTCNETVGVGL